MNPGSRSVESPVPGQGFEARLWGWAFLAWALLAFQGGLHPWQPALAALCLAALLWQGRGAVPAWSRWSARERLGGLLLLWALAGTFTALRPQACLDAAAELGLAFFSLLLLRRSRPDPALLARVWLYAGSLLCAAFLGVLWLAPHAPNTDVLLDSARVFFPNQDLLAFGLAVPALLLALERLARGRIVPHDASARTRPSGSELTGGLLDLGCAVICVLVLIAAGSRAAFLALACGAAWMAWRGRVRERPERLRLRILLAAAVLLVGVLAVAAPFSRLKVRLKAQATPGQQDTNYYRRADFWKDALSLSAHGPLLGYGLGGFAAAAQSLDLPVRLTALHPVSRYHMNLDHAHDEWLELACELGWPAGLLAAGLALSWLLALALRTPEAGVPLGLEAVLVCAGAMSLLDMNLRTPALGWGLLLSVTALFPAGAGPTTRRPFTAAPALAAAALALVCLGGAALAWAYERSAGPEGRSRGGEALLGRAALWTQPLDGGLASQARAQGLAPWPWSAWAGRADARWWWQEALGARAAGDRPGAEAAARKAVALRPYYAPGWYWLGGLLQSDGQAGQARACMDRALALEPHFCRVLAWQEDQALAAGDAAQARDLQARIAAARSLTQDAVSWDEYSRYLVSLDPGWLEAHQAPGKSKVGTK